MNNQDLLQKARNYAFLLLKFRPRSEKELCARLKNKKFTKEIIQQTISFLKDKDFLNDSLFAKTWIASRLKRPLGLRRIREELRLKGIDEEIVEAEIEEIKEGYSEEDIVTKIAKEKMAKLKGIDPKKRKVRVYAYLIRRGFSPDVVFEAVKIRDRHQLLNK